jgi:hypothetical protein
MTKKIENVEENITTVAKKRGRKSKKEIEEANKIKFNQENISVKIEENQVINQTNTKNCIDEILNSCEDDYDYEDEQNEIKITDTILMDNKPIAKKRGRKPKGGKIIQQIIPSTNIKESKPNVILHLKCSIKDLSSNNLFGSNLEGFSFINNNNLSFVNNDNNENNINEYINPPAKLGEFDNDIDIIDYDVDSNKNKDNEIREVWKKLKALEHNLHVNNIDNKKSACFWDTYEFDNPPVYIPKHFINDSYHVYGCFCSPECAVAHLMEENIDSSIKFERYQLMNHIYSKVYNYNKNIKPAPNPYYMLEKYYGNLSIQEYRSLLQNERLFLVVDKPLTRIMPELHEDNDDFIINNKIIPTNNIKLRKIQKKQTKSNILNERFGLQG